MVTEHRMCWLLSLLYLKWKATSLCFPSKATTCCTCLKLRTIHVKSHILEATPRPICLFLPLSRRRICSQAKRESSGKRPIQPMGSYGAQGHWCEFGVPKFLGKTELLGIWSGARDSANLQNSTKIMVMSYELWWSIIQKGPPESFRSDLKNYLSTLILACQNQRAYTVHPFLRNLTWLGSSTNFRMQNGISVVV